MNILISTIVWGKEHFANFVDYSLASLLAEHNAPEAAQRHTVTFLILTEERLIESFRRSETYRRTKDMVRYDLRSMESYGFNPGRIPSGFHADKYQFLSVCQNIAIELSKPYNLHIFNYADFIWADGALPGVIRKFEENNIFALLGFCMPVDEKSVKPALLARKDAKGVIALPPAEAVGLALDHMHREVKLREWNAPHISNFPSYLYWNVPGEGIVMRAFHQTILATAPSKNSSVYNAGVKVGTLDGNFSSELSSAEKTMIAGESAEVFVFSMYTSFNSSRSRLRDKEAILRTFVGAHLTAQHLQNFQTPIRLARVKNIHPSQWQEVEERSLREVGFVFERPHSPGTHEHTAVQTRDAWKNPRAVSRARYFLSNWVMPRVLHAVKSALRPVKLQARKIMAFRPTPANLLIVACIALAAGTAFFSLSEALFVWMFPDELAASSTAGVHGLVGCSALYYWTTTINRITAGIGVCGMASLAKIIGSPFLGWAVARFLCYALIPLSIAFFLRELLKVPYKVSLAAALIIFALGYFITATNQYYMFGLDLAIYAGATITFFTLAALFPKSLQSKKGFWWFCALFAANLNSHEIFLAISGFFIPLFAWKKYVSDRDPRWKRPFLLLVREALADKQVRILLVIYIVSALLTLLAPGMKMRQNVWPSSGTPLDSVLYVALAIEEMLYLMSGPYWLIIVTAALGFCFYRGWGARFAGNRLLVLYIFMAPFAYLLITAFLLGMTPSLWAGTVKPLDTRIIPTYFTTKHAVLNHGAFAIRQNLFLYVGLFVDIFLLGCALAAATARLPVKKFLMKGGFAALVAAAFLLHPDAAGSMRVLRALAGNDEAPKEPLEHASMAQLLLPGSPYAGAASRKIFFRTWQATQKTAVAGIIADRYLRHHRGSFQSSAVLDPVYDTMDAGYGVSREHSWLNQIYSMYDITQKRPCMRFLDSALTDSYCTHVAGEKAMEALLQGKKAAPAAPITFTNLQGVKFDAGAHTCPLLIDTPVKGEHYAAADNVLLHKGANYFTFETEPTATEIYIYILGPKTNIIFSWLNQQIGVNDWKKHIADDSMEPIFMQAEVSNARRKLTLAINSAEEQHVQIRWQHAMGSTGYKGDEKNTSAICGAQYGLLADKKR